MGRVPLSSEFDPEAGLCYVFAVLGYPLMSLLPAGSLTVPPLPQAAPSLRSHTARDAWAHPEDPEEARSTLYSCSEVAPQLLCSETPKLIHCC